jgi:hypothetical protein
MTQAQKTAKAKFKQAIAYRTKTGVSLKEAFAHIYGKKKVVKKAVKKAAPKKKVVKKAAKKRIAGPKDSKLIKKELAKKGLKMPHGYATVKRKRKISGVKKKPSESQVLKSIQKAVKTQKSHMGKPRVISGISKAGELKRLTQLVKTSNRLEKKVASMLKEKVSKGGYDSLRSVMKDVMYNGLQSGIISDLIYYSDTIKFFKTYKKEILSLLREQMNDMGVYDPSQLFGNNWDKEDPMAQDTQNQNLLCWFGFEEITRQLSNQLGYDI